ncbi:MAG TPA: thiamine phosphate synthase [Capsulimonadaceae bacterium]|nr:thiamine phosphate synthase [Capsulimonadaceae bacterium]
MLVTEPCAKLCEIVEEAVAGGVSVIQVRDKGAPAEDLLATTKRIKAVVRDQACILVNGSAEIAARVQLDGVHLPEHGDSVANARRILGAEKQIGRSVHSLEAALAAERDGADYVIAGTIFASSSHPGETPAGLGFLANVCRAVSIPVLAIGGVTAENCADCIAAGAAGVAVLSPIINAEDPFVAATMYLLALPQHSSRMSTG